MNLYEILALKNKTDIKNLANKTAVTLSHTFADNTARDAYFVANPTELVANLFIKVGAAYQQYVNSTWEASTAVVADLSSIESQLVSLTTNTGLPATNSVTNGDISNGVTGWNGGAIDTTWGVGDLFSCANTMTIVGSARSVNQNIASLIIGDKWYFSATFKLKTAINSGGYFGIRTQSGSAGNLVLNTTNLAIDTVKRLSGIRIIVSGDLGFYAVVYDPSALATILFDNCIAINLTSTFGVNSEPTASDMDAILAKFPNNWFTGTTAQLMTLKEVWNWMLKKKADIAQEAWINATLLNGATGTLKYRKNTLGELQIQGEVTIGTGAVGTILATLATGYRIPNNTVISAYNTSTGNPTELLFAASGNVSLRTVVTTGQLIGFNIVLAI